MTQVVIDYLGDESGGILQTENGIRLALETLTLAQVTTTSNLSETVDAEPIDFQKTNLGRM